MTTATLDKTTVPAQLWVGDLGEGDDSALGPYEDARVEVEVEQTEPNEIALHTFIDGRGSMCSFYFDRERALAMAAAFLSAATRT